MNPRTGASTFQDIVGSLIAFHPDLGATSGLWIPGYRGEPVLVTACDWEFETPGSARITFFYEGGLWRRWVSYLDFRRIPPDG